MERTHQAFGHRRSIRLSGRDYCCEGIYFVTICADRRRCIFGHIEKGRFVLNALGNLVRESWTAIPAHFSHVELSEFIVMPNHLHGMLVFHPIVGAQHCCALADLDAKHSVRSRSLGAVIRSFKAIVARKAHSELNWKEEIWQRNYFDRIIRDGQEWAETSRYILENPLKWEWDKENPQFKPDNRKGAAVLRPYK